MANLVIYTDLGSCDPDDILALMLLKHVRANVLGVIVNHNYPKRKAKLAKLLLTEIGLSHIPVFVGSGIEFNEEYSESDREQFDEDNELWPSFFGYPVSTRKPDEKQWFPNFMKAYTDVYSSEDFDTLHIEEESAYDFMMKVLKNADEKVTVACLSPPHDLSVIPTKYFNKMNIWMMGGGFESYNCIANMCDRINNPNIGYNWGICPGTVQILFNKVSDSNTKLNVISSGFIRRKQFNVDLEQYEEWYKLNSDGKLTKFMSTFMQDWEYCNRRNKLADHKNICDPVTLYAAINPSMFQTIPVQCSISNSTFENYLQKSDSKDKNILKMQLMGADRPNVNLVVKADSDINTTIVDMINKTINPIAQNVAQNL